jgi:hypothetical protein
VNPTAFGILALRAAGVSAGNARSAAWLREHQNGDGGWGFAAGTASDPDSTGAVLQALAASGNPAGIRRGVGYLRGAQHAGGGFALSGSGPVNAQSTAWAVQGLIAAGVSASSVREGGRSPLDYLASVQARDGHYRYSASSDQTPVWVTGQALLAVNGAAFPLSPVPRRSSRGGGPAGGVDAGSGSPSPTGSGDQRPTKSGESKARPEPGSTASDPAETAPLAPAAARADGGDDGGGIPGWLVALAAIAFVSGAVWGGWVLYSRRLPG